MKKWQKAKRLIILCLAELFLLLFFQSNVFAITSESQKVITPGNLKEWDDGANVTKKSSGTGKDYQVSVTADTIDLVEEYYSVYLFDDTVRSIKPYDGISFKFKNENETELKINLNLKVSSKISVSMTEDSFAILESADQSIMEVISTTYGTLSIPANFDGTIYIPFTQLYTADGERVSLTKIQSWGITTVMSKDQEIQYSIGSINFLSGSVASMKDSCYLISLSGEDEIKIPNTGSVIKSFQVEVKDLDSNRINQEVTFYLEESIEGVTISKDGKLEVTSDCVASEIMVFAKTEKSVNEGKLNISLERNSADIAATGVPKAADVPKITSTAYLKWNESVTLIRILTVLIALFFGAIFFTWFSEAKTNYSKIKSKLYKFLNEQEEEEEP